MNIFHYRVAVKSKSHVGVKQSPKNNTFSSSAIALELETSKLSLTCAILSEWDGMFEVTPFGWKKSLKQKKMRIWVQPCQLFFSRMSLFVLCVGFSWDFILFWFSVFFVVVRETRSFRLFCCENSLLLQWLKVRNTFKNFD